MCNCASCVEESRKAQEIATAEKRKQEAAVYFHRPPINLTMASTGGDFHRPGNVNTTMISSKIITPIEQISAAILEMSKRIDELEEVTSDRIDEISEEVYELSGLISSVTDDVESIDNAIQVSFESIEEQLIDTESAIIDLCEVLGVEDILEDTDATCSECLEERLEDCEFSGNSNKDISEVNVNCALDCDDVCEENMNVILSRKEIGKLYHLIGVNLKSNKDYLGDNDIKALYNRFKAHLDH